MESIKSKWRIQCTCVFAARSPGGIICPPPPSYEHTRSLPLEDQITVEQFSQLMAIFQSQRRRGKGSKMSEGDFRQTLAAVLGREESDEKIALLCAKVRAAAEVSETLCNTKRTFSCTSTTYWGWVDPPLALPYYRLVWRVRGVWRRGRCAPTCSSILERETPLHTPTPCHSRARHHYDTTPTPG